MAKYPLNLGSTFKEFLNALNTNTEDTEGIVNGTKHLKKVSIGETEEKGSVEYNYTEDRLDVKGEIVYIDSTREGEQGTDNAAITLGSGCVNIAADEQINITAREGATIFFNGKVSFQMADVIGLPSGGGSGGTLAIEVEALPTENIDDSKIYILNEIKNAEVYYFDGAKYCTIPSVVSDIVGVIPTINHYVVNELPTNAEITDLQTFSVINCYIFNDVAYVYGNAGAGNMWLTVSAIFAQMGNPTEDKGRVYDLTNASVEIGLYAYYEEFPKFYVYSDNKWKEISDSTSDRHILRLSGLSGVLSDEQYQSLVDNFSNTTIIYTLGNDTIVFNNIIVANNDEYIAVVSADYTTFKIIISKDNWFYEITYLTDEFVRKSSPNTFNSTNTFSETSSVAFNCPVDFTNATVMGLPSGGSGGSNSPLAIQVNELPTENIDNSKIYIVAENPQVYVKMYTEVSTLESILEGFGVTNPVVNYHIVSILPTEGEVTDLATMTPMHCYVNSNDGIVYFYGDAGAGNMWLSAGTLMAQQLGGDPSLIEDKGRTYNVYKEPLEAKVLIYTYWEDVQYIYNINNQWNKVNYNSFSPFDNTFDGTTHLKNRVFIGDYDDGRRGIANFFTEQVTFHNGLVTFNNGHEADIDGKVEFNGKVDFTNATVIGLSGSGLTQEEVQEMINTAINGALEGNY